MGSIIYCIVVLGAFFVIGSCLWYERRAKISPVPVLPGVRAKAAQMLRPYKTPAHTNIVDLGCGWGGMLLQLAHDYPDAKITGYDISPCPYYFSRLRTIFRRSRITVLSKDFFKEDISAVDVVFCYLSPYHMKELRPHFATLKPGSIVISCSFPIPEWVPEKTETLRGLVNIPVFLYRV